MTINNREVNIEKYLWEVLFIFMFIGLCIFAYNQNEKILEMSEKHSFEKEELNNQIGRLEYKNIISAHKIHELQFELSIKNEKIREFEETIENAEIYSKHTVQASAYTTAVDETNADNGNTALGTTPTVGRTVAVSRDLQHWLGSWIYIEGMGVYKVEDLMNARWENKIDILMPTKSKAFQFGVRELNVSLIGSERPT